MAVAINSGHVSSVTTMPATSRPPAEIRIASDAMDVLGCYVNEFDQIVYGLAKERATTRQAQQAERGAVVIVEIEDVKSAAETFTAAVKVQLGNDPKHAQLIEAVEGMHECLQEPVRDGAAVATGLRQTDVERGSFRLATAITPLRTLPRLSLFRSLSPAAKSRNMSSRTMFWRVTLPWWRSGLNSLSWLSRPENYAALGGVLIGAAWGTSDVISLFFEECRGAGHLAADHFACYSLWAFSF